MTDRVHPDCNIEHILLMVTNFLILETACSSIEEKAIPECNARSRNNITLFILGLKTNNIKINNNFGHKYELFDE